LSLTPVPQKNQAAAARWALAQTSSFLMALQLNVVDVTSTHVSLSKVYQNLKLKPWT